MYISLGPINSTRVDDFSYHIFKAPGQTFEREFGAGRFVYGSWDTNVYDIYIKNDFAVYIDKMRQLNWSSYVDSELYCVCPANLKGMDEILKSAIRGDYKQEKEDFWYAIIGPFTVQEEFITEWFEKVGISVLTRECGTVFEATLLNKQSEKLSVFLRKVYLISYYLTAHLDKLSRFENKVEKFARLCDGWFDALEEKDKARFARRLNKAKGAIKQFEEKMESDTQFILEKNAHARRHEWICSRVPSTPNTIVELGCGSGQLLRQIAKLELQSSPTIVGLEIDKYKLDKFKGSKRIKLVNTDILQPNIPIEYLSPDVLILSEVIEHLDTQQRARLVSLIKDYYKPNRLLITTPNVAWNETIGLEGYRHNDHKIEYDWETLAKEIMEPLQGHYNIIPHELDNTEGPQISFVLEGFRCDVIDNSVNHTLHDEFQRFYLPFHLEVSNYTVSKKEISNGVGNRAFSTNADNLFYIAPTIPPCEWTEKASEFLEHPQSVFDYYAERGVDKILEEKKYMGSRGYIMYDRIKDKLVVNSRNGFPFFSQEHTDLLEQIKVELTKAFDYDLVMLDCEIMPWSLKAEGLINSQFQKPGDACLSTRMRSGSSTRNVEDYLKTLANYTNSPLEIRCFNVLAFADDKRGRWSIKKFGPTLPRVHHYEELTKLNGNLLKPTDYQVIWTYDKLSTTFATQRWLEYTASGGEGFVYKTDGLVYSHSGRITQPVIKCRGRDYLRLIYGIDYTEPAAFEKIKYRSVKKKRLLAIQENELSMKILRYYLAGKHEDCKRAAAGFIGMENVNFNNVDATL